MRVFGYEVLLYGIMYRNVALSWSWSLTVAMFCQKLYCAKFWISPIWKKLFWFYSNHCQVLKWGAIQCQHVKIRLLTATSAKTKLVKCWKKKNLRHSWLLVLTEKGVYTEHFACFVLSNWNKRSLSHRHQAYTNTKIADSYLIHSSSTYTLASVVTFSEFSLFWLCRQTWPGKIEASSRTRQ